MMMLRKIKGNIYVGIDIYLLLFSNENQLTKGNSFVKMIIGGKLFK